MAEREAAAREARPRQTPETFSGEWWPLVGRMLVLTVKDFFNDSGPQWAAAIAYYGLLSTFPLILAIISIAAFFVEPEWAVERVISFLGEFLPVGEGELEEIINEAIEARQTVSLLSILGLLWGGSRVFGVVTIALNIAYDVDEHYGFVKRTFVELIMLLTIGLFAVLALSARSLLNLLLATLNILPEEQTFIYQVVTTIVPGLLLLLAFFLVYRFVPRRKVNWRAAVIGALVATLLFLIAQPLFLRYITSFADYNVIYGSVAVIIILVLWAWITAVILILGGELVAHIQAILIEGKPLAEVEKRHLLRSPTRRIDKEPEPEQEDDDEAEDDHWDGAHQAERREYAHSTTRD